MSKAKTSKIARARRKLAKLKASEKARRKAAPKRPIKRAQKQSKARLDAKKEAALLSERAEVEKALSQARIRLREINTRLRSRRRPRISVTCSLASEVVTYLDKLEGSRSRNIEAILSAAARRLPGSGKRLARKNA